MEKTDYSMANSLHVAGVRWWLRRGRKIAQRPWGDGLILQVQGPGGCGKMEHNWMVVRLDPMVLAGLQLGSLELAVGRKSGSSGLFCR